MGQLIIVLDECINGIKEYYDYSFKMSPTRNRPFLLSFIEKAEKIAYYLTQDQLVIFLGYLEKVVYAMQQEDYIQLRDDLYYNIMPWMQNEKERLIN